jgi:thioredoxin-like negative regulator of GroEL
MFEKVKEFYSVYIDKSKGLLSNLKPFVEDIKYKFDNLYETNLNNGKTHLKKGNLFDATFRFKIVNRFWPDKPEGQYYYAYCLVLTNKVSKGKEILAKIENKYDDAKILLYRLNNDELNGILTGYDISLDKQTEKGNNDNKDEK